MSFFLKKRITSLILPPGCIILLLVAGGLFLIQRRQKAGWPAVLCGLALYAPSTGAVSAVVSGPLENAYSAVSNPRGDVIVVLDGGRGEDGLERLLCAAMLWRQLRVPVIFTGNARTLTRICGTSWT